MDKNNVQTIVSDHLCLGCGICQDACPKHCISIQHTSIAIYPMVDVTKCVDCGACLKSCPGKGVMLKAQGKKLFGSEYRTYTGCYLNLNSATL